MLFRVLDVLANSTYNINMFYQSLKASYKATVLKLTLKMNKDW